MSKNLTNRKFGLLKAIRVTGKNTAYRNMWECICKCGNIVTISDNELLYNGRKSCGCKVKPGNTNHQWKGFGEIGKWNWNKILFSASRRSKKIKVSISIKYAWELFLKQNRKCALTGIELTLPTTARAPRTASLDRIDSSKGYVKGNVQWVHKDINNMKQAFTQKYFIEMCKKVAQNNT